MYLTDTSLQDIAKAVPILTPEDLQEARAVGGPEHDPMADLCVWLDRTQGNPEDFRMKTLWSWDGVLLAIGGWTSRGFIWMLTTTNAYYRKRCTYDGVAHAIRLAHEDSPRLYNQMMLTNKPHVKLMTRLGAEFVGPIVPYNSEPFQAFIVDKKEE